jgi:hypothetical protein
MFLVSMLSFLVAYVFVPGSPIDRAYSVGPEILLSANLSVLLYPIVGLFLAVLYVTLFRKLRPRMPAWLRTGAINLSWKDLRLPGIWWAVSMVIGLIVVI